MTDTPEAVIRSGLREGVQRYPLWQTEAALDALVAENARLTADLSETDSAARIVYARSIEDDRDAVRARAERDEALRVADQLRAALAFYADEKNWVHGEERDGSYVGAPKRHRSHTNWDRGERARAALSSEGQPREWPCRIAQDNTGANCQTCGARARYAEAVLCRRMAQQGADE